MRFLIKGYSFFNFRVAPGYFNGRGVVSLRSGIEEHLSHTGFDEAYSLFVTLRVAPVHLNGRVVSLKSSIEEHLSHTGFHKMYLFLI